MIHGPSAAGATAVDMLSEVWAERCWSDGGGHARWWAARCAAAGLEVGRHPADAWLAAQSGPAGRAVVRRTAGGGSGMSGASWAQSGEATW